MFYTRLILSKLEEELNTKEIVIITGMRQVGKTTMLTYLYDRVKSTNKVFLDLENPLHRKLFEEENYNAVWNNLREFGIINTEKVYIFLDEVQNLPQISKVAKYFYDHWGVKFFLTGSSSYYLKNLFPESLAGRKIIFEMFPLTFTEFLAFNQIPKASIKSFSEKAKTKDKISYEQIIPYYREFLEFGGFPKVVLEKSKERKKVLLSEIFTSYFEKDAKAMADFREMSKLRDLILLLIPRIGSKIEVAKLANSLSVSRETVYNYLSFLEQTYFISLLSKFSGSIDRQAAGSKKLFLCDVGIANILGHISFGQMFEQSIFQNLRTQHKLCYYSKDGGSEIDFIIDGLFALGVKISVSARDVANLKQRSSGLHINKQYVTSLEYHAGKTIILATDL